MKHPDTPAEVIRDPEWLAHRYDARKDAFQFRFVDRSEHRKTTFLTDEALQHTKGPVAIARRDTRPAQRAPIHFIFHSAYCCSTMLARAFDLPGVSMALKEPVLLNDLVGWRRRGGRPDQVMEVLDRSLDLLARPFGDGEAVIVKPSNIVNGLAQAILTARPQSRALFLFAPLEAYLRSIAKKDIWGRLWVRELLVGLIKDDLIDLGFDTEAYLKLTDLQVAAIGWLAQHMVFQRFCAEFGSGRVATVDSETLIDRRHEAMTGLAALFDLPLDAPMIEAIVEGPAFTRHSKLATDFGADARAAEHRDAAELHADEIGKILVWANAVAASAGIELTQKTPLLK